MLVATGHEWIEMVYCCPVLPWQDPTEALARFMKGQGGDPAMERAARRDAHFRGAPACEGLKHITFCLKGTNGPNFNQRRDEFVKALT